ncbi:MAG: tRNA uridine-5-carboxymethylaminomethyl(34) synthesis GTPase MnmE [Peptostreptococcaceae bacterium]|nr:tRNA uridine-5-carboxymethylaminomethyl(34) synthesis GTPase MnmE [Peptostreptococcaceae bacterium]
MENTIAAIATAYGEGGIGIVKISGGKAKEILDQIFVGINDKPLRNRYLTFGHITDSDTGKIIDEALVSYMKGPKTYTTEDVVEINCHGSIISLRKTLELVLRKGAILAEPGEFTKRAFLNGRLDLVQAEAVIDLIRAKSDKSFEISINQLEGFLSKKVLDIRKMLLELLIKLAVNIDYPDEDIEELSYREVKKSLLQISDMIEILVSTAETGRLIQEGLAVSIIGKPNVGKSSLMNALLRESRAIVTEIPGTTRDTIEEFLSIKGIAIKLTDTAGIRNTEDTIEKIGIEKSKESFNKADLIIFVLDGSNELSKEDREIIEIIGKRKSLVLINKGDLEQKIDTKQIKKLIPEAKVIFTIATEGAGINAVEKEIEELVYGGKVRQGESMLVSNVRQKNLLEKAGLAIKEAIEQTEASMAMDFLEIDVKAAWELLGEIIGETFSENIIDEVFARFCLGK